jgi:hypothetical protein
VAYSENTERFEVVLTSSTKSFEQAVHDTMASTRVLKFSRSDNETAYVLLQSTTKGSKPLDLRLVATEGEAAYVATRKCHQQSHG